MSAATAAAAPPEAGVVGFVEAATATAVLGWAWVPGRTAEPLRVELRLGEQVVAEATADQPREDLARNGVGEGRHAFTLPVPEAARPRLAELRVFARAPGGPATALGSPPAAPGLSERLDAMQRALEMVVGSQRVLHRNVQAALLAAPAAGVPAPAHDAAAEALREQVATLELFVTRLDDRLAALAPPGPPPAPRRALTAALAASGAALALSAWGLIHALPA